MTAPVSVTANFTLKTFALTVTKSGNGVGIVSDATSVVSCGATCVVSFPYGTVVRLAAVPSTVLSTESSHTAWSGACAGTGVCSVTMTANASVNANFILNPNLVFVTNGTFNGNLGGLAGANTKCQAAAQAAGLAGTYRAWVSTQTTDAINQLVLSVPPSLASGWARRDGLPVANLASDFGSGKHFYPVRITESGVDLLSSYVYTGTTTSAVAPYGPVRSTATCASWIDGSQMSVGEVGDTSSTGSAFTSSIYSTTLNCSAPLHLYCLGVDRAATVAVTPTAGARLAFLSNGAFPLGGGLAAADSLCQAEAQAAGWTGTFRALLPVSAVGSQPAASAASRFDATAAPWVRADGVRLSPTAASFFTATYWDTPLNVTAAGVVMSNMGVWGGASSLTASGASSGTCSNWGMAPNNTAVAGRSGLSKVSDAIGFDPASSCTATYNHLYCLQQ
jgi:hypothetical protein